MKGDMCREAHMCMRMTFHSSSFNVGPAGERREERDREGIAIYNKIAPTLLTFNLFSLKTDCKSNNASIIFDRVSKIFIYGSFNS